MLGQFFIVLFIGPEKCGIVPEPGQETALGCAFALRKQVAGPQQAFFRNVVSDGVTGFFLKHPHHVVGAEAAAGRKGLDTQVLVEVPINIGYKS